MTLEAGALLRRFRDLAAVDTMCHLGQWPYRLTARADVDDLRRYARRHGLREIWVSHIASLFGFDTRAGNEATLRSCGSDDLFRMFAVIDPSEHGWRDEFAWAVEQGFSGVRLAPGLHGYPPPDAAAVVEACESADMTVQVIARMDDARVRHPLSPARDLKPRHLAELVRTPPAIPVLISGVNQADATELSRHLGDDVPPGVRWDLWHLNGPTGVIDGYGAETGRWVFGSGFPVQAPEPTMLQLTASRLSAEQLVALTTA